VLKRLEVAYCDKVTNAGFLGGLARLSNLRELTVEGCYRVRPARLCRKLRALLPELVVLDVRAS
jgi:hypothetical protein